MVSRSYQVVSVGSRVLHSCVHKVGAGLEFVYQCGAKRLQRFQLMESPFVWPSLNNALYCGSVCASGAGVWGVRTETKCISQLFTGDNNMSPVLFFSGRLGAAGVGVTLTTDLTLGQKPTELNQIC